MIKSTGEFAKSTVSNLRGGVGDLTRIDIFNQDEMLKKARVCAIFSFPAGASIGDHSHGPEAEIYYILSGSFRITDNGITKDLSVGDAVFTGGGNSHSIINIGDTEASLLAIVIN